MVLLNIYMFILFNIDMLMVIDLLISIKVSQLPLHKILLTTYQPRFNVSPAEGGTPG